MERDWRGRLLCAFDGFMRLCGDSQGLAGINGAYEDPMPFKGFDATDAFLVVVDLPNHPFQRQYGMVYKDLLLHGKAANTILMSRAVHTTSSGRRVNK